MSSPFVPSSHAPPPRRDILAPLEPHELERQRAAQQGASAQTEQRLSPPRGVNAPLPLVQQDLHASRSPATPRSMPRTTPRAVPQVGPSKAQLSVWRVIAIVAIVACVATGAQLYRVMGDRDLLHETLVARGVATSRQGASLQSDIADRDRLIGALTGPSMRVIDLLNYGSSGPVGRVFWDKAMGTWTMYTYTLPAPKPGDTYQLWIVTNDGHPPFSAGTFVPDAEGKAVVRATYAIGPNALGRIAVSEEPEGGSPAPSRHIVLAGR